MKQKREKWLRWLEEIKEHLYAVMESRYVFRETFRLINDNPALPRTSLVYHFLQVWYGDHAIMAVQRQIKVGDGAISLLGLLQDLQTNHELLALDSAVIKADIADLRESAIDVERFADKCVAHHHRGAAPATPTYEQLYGCLDLIDTLFQKYYWRVAGKALSTTTPEIGYNWKKAYEQPWVVR